MEITWPPSTTREVKTIFSVTSTGIYLSIERLVPLLVPMEAREEPMIQRKLSISNVSRRAWCTALMVATLVLFVAACGSNTSSSGSGGTTPTSSGSGYGGGRYGSGGTTPTASSTGSLIKTATATVNGTSQTILTNARGLTLYYRTSDVPPATVCSGGCAGAWPPLVVSGSGTPTSATSLPGELTVIADANGNPSIPIQVIRAPAKRAAKGLVASGMSAYRV